MLTQSAPGPSGEHFQYSSKYRFPHEDSVGVCWQPQGYDPKTDSSDSRLWLDYEDSVSEVMRAECDLQPWMQVCQIPLLWERVDCKVYIERAKAEEAGSAGEEEEKKGLLPIWVVIPVQVLSGIWKALAISIVFLPWWLILASVAALDWVLDWVFLLAFGLFCRPCAGFFIWILNIAFLPFTIWGWILRIFLETYGAIIDGWLLLFKGNGCYLGFGHNCWFKPERSLRTVLDIPLFFTQPGDSPSMGVDNVWDTL